MKYAAVRSAIVDGTTMSHKSSFAVGYSPCETFSPTNRATIMKKLTNPGGLVFVMPCRNPNPSVTHATARAMRWPCVVMLRIILHANQLLASAGEFIISSSTICLRAAFRQYAACAPLPFGVPQPAYAS
eukprot:CAMPEP_0197123952 /NCGR_PEP_ID=MMETSP1390-20130617/7210_1 /TAXON_ID=38833 /ORGANISM="Micromonas sp., Strain CCMP2099" /LENGTH=128 /DNA_ID=CAMNT_0042566047 /DNA_START=1 /DNA_END=387 /DNA_ORIENTATION=+